jgi:hypothetical protein
MEDFKRNKFNPQHTKDYKFNIKELTFNMKSLKLSQVKLLKLETIKALKTTKG